MGIQSSLTSYLLTHNNWSNSCVDCSGDSNMVGFCLFERSFVTKMLLGAGRTSQRFRLSQHLTNSGRCIGPQYSIPEAYCRLWVASSNQRPFLRVFLPKPQRTSSFAFGILTSKQASKLRLCEAPDGIGSDGIRSAAPALHCITNWLQHVHPHRSESSTADSRTFHSSRTVDLIGHLLAEASVQLVSIRWVNVKVVVTCFNSHQSNLQSINCCPIPALP